MRNLYELILNMYLFLLSSAIFHIYDAIPVVESGVCLSVKLYQKPVSL